MTVSATATPLEGWAQGDAVAACDEVSDESM